MALRTDNHLVHCIAALVQVIRIYSNVGELGTRTRRRLVDSVVDSNSSHHPMHCHQTDARHQHGRLLQMPQSKEVAAVERKLNR